MPRVAWEWVPAVSAATSTTIVVGMTLWATSRTGREGRQHAETVARQTAEHAEAMAADERTHKRLESAYVELLQMIEQAGHWADRLYPLMDTDPPRPLPEMPSVDEQIRVRALVDAYGSDEVRELLGQHSRIIHGLRVAAEIVATSKDETALKQRIAIGQELRPAEREKRAELRRVIATELRGSP